MLPYQELEAEVYFLSSSKGGRHSPVRTVYRGNFYYDGQYWIAEQTFPDQELCYPGESVKVQIRTLNPVFHVGKFWVGKEFEIREGINLVGVGKILRILREDFQYWDFITILQGSEKATKAFTWSKLSSFKEKLKKNILATKLIKSISYKPSKEGSTHLIATYILAKTDKSIGNPLEKLYEAVKDCREDGKKYIKIDVQVTSVLFAIQGDDLLTGEIRIEK